MLEVELKAGLKKTSLKNHHMVTFLEDFTIFIAVIFQEPTFHLYLIVPAILFSLDKLISVSRKKREIPLMEANILPSEVSK